MIRWPKMQCVEMRFLKGTDIGEWMRIRHWTLVERDYDLDRLWAAPCWIGWLYRLLPNHFNVNLTAWKTEPSHFLANVAAPTWRFGFLIRNRIPAVLVEMGGGSYDSQYRFYLPWGLRLYCRLTTLKWPMRRPWASLPFSRRVRLWFLVRRARRQQDRLGEWLPNPVSCMSGNPWLPSGQSPCLRYSWCAGPKARPPTPCPGCGSLEVV
ncbi:hypothetical protein LCGC14_1853560 [marine sediment metagenome]|uniref:Uncharacterized protein n=1 Tax=marine sediment metagenome TaxID=412755 RepID=A0A0F9GA08_9ZZZZ